MKLASPTARAGIANDGNSGVSGAADGDVWVAEAVVWVDGDVDAEGAAVWVWVADGFEGEFVSSAVVVALGVVVGFEPCGVVMGV